MKGRDSCTLRQTHQTVMATMCHRLPSVQSAGCSSGVFLCQKGSLSLREVRLNDVLTYVSNVFDNCQ